MMKLIGEKLRQYDLNRTVELIPKHGLTVETVLFYKNSPEPLVVAHREEDGKIIADIPNIFLKAFGTLSMEVHMIDEEGHLVSKQASFYVSKREMPEGYVYVETPVLKLGSGGSGGGGLSVKTITFTDRPTAWEWLKENYNKVLKGVLETALVPVPVVCNNVSAMYTAGKVKEVFLTSVTPTELNDQGASYINTFMAITDQSVTISESGYRLFLTTTPSIVVDGSTPTTIPDEYWEPAAAKITVYYIE